MVHKSFSKVLLAGALSAVVSACTLVPQVTYEYDEKCQQFTQNSHLKPVLVPFQRTLFESCSDHECLDKYGPTKAEFAVAVFSGIASLTHNIIQDIDDKRTCNEYIASSVNHDTVVDIPLEMTEEERELAEIERDIF